MMTRKAVQKKLQKSENNLLLSIALILLSASGLAKLYDILFNQEYVFRIIDAVLAGIGVLGLTAGIVILIKWINMRRENTAE